MNKSYKISDQLKQCWDRLKTFPSASQSTAESLSVRSTEEEAQNRMREALQCLKSASDRPSDNIGINNSTNSTHISFTAIILPLIIKKKQKLVHHLHLHHKFVFWLSIDLPFKER